MWNGQQKMGSLLIYWLQQALKKKCIHRYIQVMFQLNLPKFGKTDSSINDHRASGYFLMNRKILKIHQYLEKFLFHRFWQKALQNINVELFQS